MRLKLIGVTSSATENVNMALLSGLGFYCFSHSPFRFLVLGHFRDGRLSCRALAAPQFKSSTSMNICASLLLALHHQGRNRPFLFLHLLFAPFATSRMLRDVAPAPRKRSCLQVLSLASYLGPVLLESKARLLARFAAPTPAYQVESCTQLKARASKLHTWVEDACRE